MTNRFFFLIMVLAVFSSACSDYQKVLKSADMQYKYDKALEYYQSGKITRAYPLFEELYIVYRGTEKGEKIGYYQANCDLKLKDYITAAHRFSQFHKNYPSSVLAERAQFLSAFCTYKLSPRPSLDQTDTYNAIRSLQLFAIQYPNSSDMDSVNILLDELRGKLELKEYKSCMLYYKMERYKAAKIALDGFNGRYPNSAFKEETNFLAARSAYLLAQNSVEEKKLERIEDAINVNVTFAARFPDSRYAVQSKEMIESLRNANLK